MKFIYIFLSIILFSSDLNAQNLSAKVIDENNQPLIGATVYFDGTTRGVITDTDGVFNIKRPENLNNPILVITYLGYENIFESDIDNLKAVYQLQAQTENLDTVNLYGSPFNREDMMKVFKKYFLGEGKAARQCEIENLDDIILYYVVKDNTLYAKSINPIIVNNQYLGYKVKFDLKDFQVKYNYKTLSDQYLKSSFYAGFSFFEDVNPRKERKRIKTYKGSLKHFFKSLINGDLGKTKFILGNDGFVIKPEKVFEVTKIDSLLYKISIKAPIVKSFNGMRISPRIILNYKNEASTFQFSKNEFRVDGFGNNIDIQNFYLIGDLANYRIAKMLPLNFSLGEM